MTPRKFWLLVTSLGVILAPMPTVFGHLPWAFSLPGLILCVISFVLWGFFPPGRTRR